MAKPNDQQAKDTFHSALDTVLNQRGNTSHTSSTIWNILPGPVQDFFLDFTKKALAGGPVKKPDDSWQSFVGSVLWNLIPDWLQTIIEDVLDLLILIGQWAFVGLLFVVCAGVLVFLLFIFILLSSKTLVKHTILAKK